MAAAFATLRPLPSPLTGLPRLPEPPFQRAVPTTPADRAGARVDCFPAHAAFPKWQEGRHPHCHFRDAMGQTAARLYHRHLRKSERDYHAPRLELVLQERRRLRDDFGEGNPRLFGGTPTCHGPDTI